jgi:hypothetical protein
LAGRQQWLSSLSRRFEKPSASESLCEWRVAEPAIEEEVDVMMEGARLAASNYCMIENLGVVQFSAFFMST